MPYLPGVVAGIFASRVIGEWVGLPGWGAAVAFSLALGGIGGWLAARWPLIHTWPYLIPILYIFYPEPDPPLALQVFLLTGFAALLNWHSLRGNPPAPAHRHVLPVAVALALGFLVLYVRTLAPDVLAADSGELQIVAAQLGVAHPPGFPLYVMVAHLFTRLLPFVAPAYAVNLLSAVTSALTVAVVYATVALITRRQLPGLIAAVVLGTATTFWSQATTANVRSLTGLFTALIIFALIRFREASLAKDRAAADRWLVVTGLFMGFGLTHHVSLIFLIAVGIVFILIVDPAIARAPRRWIKPVAAGLVGLLPLIFLPLRASADVRGASPNLATWAGFVEHALATGFRGDLFYFVEPADFFQRLRVMGNVMTFQFSALVLAGMVLGLVFIIRKDRALALLLGGSFFIFLLVAATYRAPQTVEYMIPAYIAAALALGCGLGFIADDWNRSGNFALVISTLVTTLVLVGSIRQLSINYSASGGVHEATSARDYAEPLLLGAPADTIILAHWHWATPLWYLQEIEGVRPDVDVQFVYPEGESYEATWQNRVRNALGNGRPVITTWVPPSPPADLPVPEPLGEALLFTQQAREVLPPGFAEAGFTLSDSVEVLGYHIESPTGRFSAGEEIVITVAWRPTATMDTYNMFVHLIGSDGLKYGQDDRSVVAAEDITLTQFRATPGAGIPLGALSIVLGVNASEISSAELAKVDIMLSANNPWSRHKTARTLLDQGDMVLVGYDWDHSVADRARLYLHWQHGGDGYSTQIVDDVEPDAVMITPYRGPWGVPVHEWRFPRGKASGHYVPLGQGIVWTGETLNEVSLSPGEAIVLDQEFRSGRPLNRDYVVSVRLIGLEDDGVSWNWWDLNDSIPAMGGIPTLKWIEGSFVRSPHRVTVAETAWTGQVLTGALTVYDAFTNRTLPILDERLTAQNPWIPLCQGEVASPD